MSFAIRFLPADPARRDEPAMYLSTHIETASFAARVTSIAFDVWSFDTESGAVWELHSERVDIRCQVDRLVTDIVPFDDAIADCANVEPRPRKWRSRAASWRAYGMLTSKERDVLARHAAT